MIVNLGCGSDVLPWRFLSRHPDLCQGAVFVDVDFPALSLAKREVVTSTSQLMAPLSNVDLFPETSPLLLRSDQYYIMGCDLRHVSRLQEALFEAFSSSADFLFIAEVSITYMEAADADAVIRELSPCRRNPPFLPFPPSVDFHAGLVFDTNCPPPQSGPAAWRMVSPKSPQWCFS